MCRELLSHLPHPAVSSKTAIFGSAEDRPKKALVRRVRSGKGEQVVFEEVDVPHS
jgi:hypothetical protein